MEVLLTDAPLRSGDAKKPRKRLKSDGLAEAIAANKRSNASFQIDPGAVGTETAKVSDKEAFNVHCQLLNSVTIQKNPNVSRRRHGAGICSVHGTKQPKYRIAFIHSAIVLATFSAAGSFRKGSPDVFG